METKTANFLIVANAAEVASQAWAASAALRLHHHGDRDAFITLALQAAVGPCQSDQPTLTAEL